MNNTRFSSLVNEESTIPNISGGLKQEVSYLNGPSFEKRLKETEAINIQ